MSLFHEVPFHTPNVSVEQPFNMRLARPVQDVPGENALDALYENAARVLKENGFTSSDTTLRYPNEYEVTVISKGSINRAITQTPYQLLAHARPQVVRDILLEELPGSAKRPIPAVMARIGIYDSKEYEVGAYHNLEQTISKQAHYLAVFLNIIAQNMKDNVGIERRTGYDTLRSLSDLDQLFAPKLGKLKPAAFHFAAFHDPKHLPTEQIIESLMPQGLLPVILGAVEAGPFKD